MVWQQQATERWKGGCAGPRAVRGNFRPITQQGCGHVIVLQRKVKSLGGAPTGVGRQIVTVPVFQENLGSS